MDFNIVIHSADEGTVGVFGALSCDTTIPTMTKQSIKYCRRVSLV